MNKYQRELKEARDELTRMEQDARRFREARICRAARLDPDLPLALLAERFAAVDVPEIRRLLSDNGIPRERDEFASYWRAGGTR